MNDKHLQDCCQNVAMNAEEKLGILWWNGLTRTERISVLEQAGYYHADPSVADAWKLWKDGKVFADPALSAEVCQTCGRSFSRLATQCPHCHPGVTGVDIY